MKNKNSGFTLLEMSIVIVIVALVAGAIVGAKSMMRAAQIKNALGEYDTYLKAIGEFRDKYLALPGDMKNATTMFGASAGGCPGTAGAAPTTGSCNGNGNGRIGMTDTSGYFNTDFGEMFRAWEQLAHAGFIKGQYNGVWSPVWVTDATIGLNVPESALEGAGWSLYYYIETIDNGLLWPDTYGHMFSLGSTRSGSITSGATLSAPEAFALDQKMDDGKPGRGVVRAWRPGFLANCTNSDTTQDAQAYIATKSTTAACALVFIPGVF